MGNSITQYWARLAKTEIVAETARHGPDPSAAFWSAPADRRKAAIQEIANLGTRALLVYLPGREPGDPGWGPVANTGYYSLIFEEAGPVIPVATP